MGSKPETKTRLEEILAEWDLDPGKDYESDTDTITLTNTLSNVSISAPYTFRSTTGTNFPNAIWTTNGTTTQPWFTASPNSTSTKISLSGENADIEVNGWSLVQAVKRIEERLDLFQLNPKLEAEWEELRELGEQYRKLEQHIKNKQATFERLKAMPAPEVD